MSSSISSAFRSFVSNRTRYRNIQRYHQVIQVLAKYGFGQLLGEMKFWEKLSRKTAQSHGVDEKEQRTQAQRIRLALEELGPTFVKVGQFLSTRPDLVPPDIIAELENLQSRAKHMPSATAREIIEVELARNIDDVFASFDDIPIAAASLSQVHKATLKDGAMVAVKVQRPGIKDVIEADIEIMMSLAGAFERHTEQARLMNLEALVSEFATNIRRELNFRTEAINMRRFAANFAGVSYLHVPEVYEDMCSRRLLVMEYMDGINISDIDKLRAGGYDLRRIATSGVDVAMKSIFEHGFFHADPHPGNIFVLPGNVMCLLDFGMVGRLSDRERDSLVKLAYKTLMKDTQGTAKAVLEITETGGTVCMEDLEADIAVLIEQYAHMKLESLHLGDVVNDLRQLIQTHDLRFKSNLVWLAKGVATIEDVARRLYPDFNMIDSVRPYMNSIFRRHAGPLGQAREMGESALDFAAMLKDLPYETADVLRQIKEGRLKVEFEHSGLEPMRRTMDRLSNRIALAIILAGVLLGSSLVVLANLPPFVAGVPVIGIAGFVISALLGLGLVVSIIRSGL